MKYESYLVDGAVERLYRFGVDSESECTIYTLTKKNQTSCLVECFVVYDGKIKNITTAVATVAAFEINDEFQIVVDVNGIGGRVAPSGVVYELARALSAPYERFNRVPI